MWDDSSVCVYEYLCPSRGVKEMFPASPAIKSLTSDFVSDYQIAECFPYGALLSIRWMMTAWLGPGALTQLQKHSDL